MNSKFGVGPSVTINLGTLSSVGMPSKKKPGEDTADPDNTGDPFTEVGGEELESIRHTLESAFVCNINSFDNDFQKETDTWVSLWKDENGFFYLNSFWNGQSTEKTCQDCSIEEAMEVYEQRGNISNKRYRWHMFFGEYPEESSAKQRDTKLKGDNFRF